MNDQNNQAPDGLDPKAGWNLLRLLCDVFCFSVEPILHKRMGTRYMGGRCLLVIPLTMFFSMFWVQEDSRPLTWFLGIWVFACFCNRIGGFRAHARGESEPHSYYNGWPRLHSILPFLSEWTIKRMVEPVLVGLIAFIATPLNWPLAAYLWCCTASLLASLAMHDLGQHQRAMNMRDAMIEQKQIHERFNRLNRNRR